MRGRRGGRNIQRGRGRSDVSECLPDRVRVRSTCTAATGAGCCPSARASRAGKLIEPHCGQLSQLGARSECLGRHDPRARKGGLREGKPTKIKENINMNQEKKLMMPGRRRRNRARAERRRRAHKRLMAARRRPTANCNTEVEPKSGSMQ